MSGELSAELLPCPFCGGEARLEPDYHDASRTWCGYCPACDYSLEFKLKPEAIAAWNHRPEPPSNPGGGEAWREALVAAEISLTEALSPFRPLDSKARAEQALSTVRAAIAAAPTATSPTTPDEEALRLAGKFLNDYFSPWGSWKTAWWEGEVGDHLEFGADNALKHLRALLNQTEGSGT